MRWSLLPVLVFVACSGDGKDEPNTTHTGTEPPEAEAATWLVAADWGWTNFNHRVSHITLRADPPEAAIIGGTSTTNIVPELDKACDASSCKEFPFADTSELSMVVGTVSTNEASFATGSAAIVAGARGDTTTLAVPGVERSGSVVAVLRGFSLDTAHALDGPESCYNPAYGWHPTVIGVELLDPRAEDGELRVDVRATFGAGLTEDPDRVCIDEVHDQARVPFTVDVLFVVADEASAHPVHQEEYFPWNGSQFTPDEQVVPGPVALPSGDGLMGWSSVVYHFNEHSEVGRGAYIRTLHFGVDGANAYGNATNYSPLTQLHDFGFMFDGVVQQVPLDGVELRTYTATLPAEVDSSGVATVFPL